MPIPFAPRRPRRKNSAAAVVDPPEYFDFDFRSRPTPASNASILQRPRTASAGNSVRKQSAPERPRTADRPTASQAAPARTEDNWIGLALGSPTHAPTGWMDSITPVSPKHAFQHEGPFPPHLFAPWWKIGGLFKTQSDTAKPLPARPAVDGLTRRTSSHARVTAAIPEASLPEPSSSAVTPTEMHSSAAPLTLMETGPDRPFPLISPKLEIDIPVGDFDRYSVMFGNVFGSNSLDRPSRASRVAPTLEEETLSSHQEHSEPADSTILWPMRSTSLRLPRPSSIDFSRQPDDAALHEDVGDTDYAFEPVLDANSSDEAGMDDAKDHSQLVMSAMTEEDLIARLKARIISVQKQASETDVLSKCNDDPITKAIAGQRSISPPQPEEKPKLREAAATIVQSVTSPDPNPRQRSHTLDSIRPEPLRRQQMAFGECFSSPEDGPSHDRDAPWRSTDSLQSSASSQTSAEEEIFFDMKPFRDSKGTRDSQYVITNPNAVAVEVARSVSLKNRKRLQKTGFSPDLMGYEWTPEMLHDPWAMPPDLQAAEHFCISSDMQAVEPVLRLSMFDKAIDEVEKLALAAQHDDNEPQHHYRNKKPAVKRQVRMRSRSKGLAIGIPSPITEKSFEETPQGSPRLERPPRVQRSHKHIASQTRASPTIIVSSLSSAFDIPPPVPRKDSKFLGKRKGTSKPTDPKQSRATGKTSTRQGRPKPTVTRPQAEKKVAAEERAFQVKPAAEVAVARTMSLSRKVSHKIFVRRQDSHGRLPNQPLPQQAVASSAC